MLYLFCCDFAALIKNINMKLRLQLKETIWREIDVDTEDFNIDDTDVFEVAQFINNIKDDIRAFVDEYAAHPVRGEISEVSLNKVV